MIRILPILCMSLVLACAPGARAETPDEWIKLLTRVHGGFGSFLPVGIRIGEDAMKRLDAKPRELSVVFYQGEGNALSLCRRWRQPCRLCKRRPRHLADRHREIPAWHVRRGGDPTAQGR